MRTDCIIDDGETPPANPGHGVPSGDSLYARCGGVYPLALVCDRLVDALLSDKSVRIQVGGARTMASLKYCFTELCCCLAGGPETMTPPSAHEVMEAVKRAEAEVKDRARRAVEKELAGGFFKTETEMRVVKEKVAEEKVAAGRAAAKAAARATLGVSP